MNHLTAAELLTRVIVTAAQGADDDDGVVISDDDLLAMTEVVKWLVTRAQAVEGRAKIPAVRLDLLERMAIDPALERHGGNQTKAAASLGINKTTIFRKRMAWAANDRRAMQCSVLIPADGIRGSIASEE